MGTAFVAFKRWDGGCYSYDDPNQQPLPKGKDGIESELSSLFGAVYGMEVDVENRMIKGWWGSYKSCLYHMSRTQAWFAALRDQVRRAHQPNIPRFGGTEITSYIETLFSFASRRLSLVAGLLGYPNGESLSWQASEAAKIAERIYKNWPKEDIDFNGLSAGIQNEITWLDSGEINSNDVARDPAIEARDKWIYERCVKHVPYGTIMLRLKKKPPAWPRLESINGIKDAAAAYADRNHLPAIPKRKRGRPVRK